MQCLYHPRASLKKGYFRNRKTEPYSKQRSARENLQTHRWKPYIDKIIIKKRIITEEEKRYPGLIIKPQWLNHCGTHERINNLTPNIKSGTQDQMYIRVCARVCLCICLSLYLSVSVSNLYLYHLRPYLFLIMYIYACVYVFLCVRICTWEQNFVLSWDDK